MKVILHYEINCAMSLTLDIYINCIHVLSSSQNCGTNNFFFLKVHHFDTFVERHYFMYSQLRLSKRLLEGV